MSEGATDHEPTTAEEPTDSIRELLDRARAAAEVRPELAGVLEQVERLSEVELQHHPEVFEQAHQVLRSVLANAGDAPDPLPEPSGSDAGDA